MKKISIMLTLSKDTFKVCWIHWTRISVNFGMDIN